jgi:hypothetical protein
MTWKQKGVIKQVRTPDPRMRQQQEEDPSDPSRLHQNPCKFWKIGKCNWGWSCRFLHGAVPEEDPRRSEYRGAPVDFTQFPRPILYSPHFSSAQSFHVEDQSRTKQYRKPVVMFAVSEQSVKVQISKIKDSLIASGVDILASDFNTMTTDEVKEACDTDSHATKLKFDYIVYVDLFGITLYPDGVSVKLTNIGAVIQNSWDMRNVNLGLEELELLTYQEFERIILKLAPDLFENIEETIIALQNETSDAISSMTTQNCQFSNENLQALRTKLQQFFAKLNMANSVIADLPIYIKNEPITGQTVRFCPPPPGGLSGSAQKVLSYMIGKSLSQIHMCLSHVNKLLNEFSQSRITFAPPVPTSPGIHPTPLCVPVCSTICGESITDKSELGRKLEPEVVVDSSAKYSLSFRNRFDTGFSPFGPYYN